MTEVTIPVVSSEQFDHTVGQPRVAIVDFTADWCPPCKHLIPILEELQEQYGDKVSISKVNVDQSPELAARYGVMSMPTVIFYESGVPVEKLIGLRPKAVYVQLIEKYTVSK